MKPTTSIEICEECNLPMTICSMVAHARINHERLGASKEESLEWNKEYRDALKDWVKSESNKAVIEAQISILRGFRRRDFVRDDFYEHAVIERMQKIQSLEEQIGEE